jgi:hypothetical protein
MRKAAAVNDKSKNRMPVKIEKIKNKNCHSIYIYIYIYIYIWYGAVKNKIKSEYTHSKMQGRSRRV